MCTLKKKSQLGHNRTSSNAALRWQAPMPLPESAPANCATAAQPVTCGGCQAIHYDRPLACRKCGTYFAHAERPAMVPILLVPSAAATAAAIVGIISTVLLGLI